MSLISVNNLTFGYENSYENIFENTSFEIDTDWKLGFIGRNGRGKTTFLKLLMGEYNYIGSIFSSEKFDYFPFVVDNDDITLNIIRNKIAPFDKWEEKMKLLLEIETKESLDEYGNILEVYINNDGYIVNELIEKELSKLDVAVDILQRPFSTLSNGEKTKIMLVALFLKKNNFLLIDEPTNHLDLSGRECVAKYLKNKSGFILVSHDRNFLDLVVDHIVSINKNSIEIQKGNFSTWQENKDRNDNFEINQNNKLKKEIGKLEVSFKRTAKWSDDVEKSKIGTHVYDRGAVGHKAAKMMKRAKSIENRKESLIEDKKMLLKNIERTDALKVIPLNYHKDVLFSLEDVSIVYGNNILVENINFSINKGDRIAIRGKNGSGKTSLLKILIKENNNYKGNINSGSGIKISYISQDTSFLNGSFNDFINSENIDETLFKVLLAKLDFNQNMYDKKLENLSDGQKKKVLIAKSLLTSAHIYIWDEPLNFIDIISRIQIENLILEYNPTMLFIEHDLIFSNTIATKVIEL